MGPRRLQVAVGETVIFAAPPFSPLLRDLLKGEGGWGAEWQSRRRLAPPEGSLSRRSQLNSKITGTEPQGNR